MSLSDLKSPYEEEAEKRRSNLIGIYIAVLAALLAICGMGGGNATKDATRAHIEASNMWAFFQAKNIRRTSHQLTQETLEMMLAANPAMPEAARTAIAGKIEAHKQTYARLTSDKTKNEGLDELFMRARALEAERDLALKRDPFFDLSQALLQIAIVLASISLLAGSNMLLWLSGLVGIGGTALLVKGFLLVAEKMPLVG